MRLDREGNTVIVHLEGEMDHCTAQHIRRMLDQYICDGSVKNMVLDMEEMTFMDSSGIGVILGRYRLLQQRGGKMMVKNMNRQVEKVFHLSGMNQVIEIV